MLEIRKTAISFNEQDMMELERIVTDADEKEALRFLKRAVYDRVAQSQKGRLQSHLDGGGDPVKNFTTKSK
ncbi:MAG: hypothetical protein ABIH70_03650 [Chloroflexota bacterium]